MKILMLVFESKGSVNESNIMAILNHHRIDYWHHIKNTFLVDTHHSPRSFTGLFEPIFQNSETRFFVVEITNEYWGYLPLDAWAWINKSFGRHKVRNDNPGFL